MQNVIPVVGDRYQLSEFRQDDAKDLIAWLNEPELYSNTLRIPSPYTMKDAEQFLSMVETATCEQGHPRHFALRDGARLVGALAFEDLSYGHRGEIGYWLAKPFRGRGLMTMAVQAACRHAFHEWRLVRIIAHVFARNTASAKLLERCGFQLEGKLRKHHRKDDQFIDSLLYALLKEEERRQGETNADAPSGDEAV